MQEDFKTWFNRVFEKRPDGSRKNKILLAYLTSPDVRRYVRNSGLSSFAGSMQSIKLGTLKELGGRLTRYDRRRMYLLEVDSMPQLFNVVMREICAGLHDVFCSGLFAPYNSTYRIKDNGVCLDGDISSVCVFDKRNRQTKIKAGKYFKLGLQETEFGKMLPPQVVTFMCEEFARKFKSYAYKKSRADLKLHVGSDRADFERIYDSYVCHGDFHSCMVDEGFEQFYYDCVSAQAAWLEDADGNILARCIVFTDVEDVNSGEKFRLAERQYSSECDTLLKQILVNRLIAGGYIDGYKVVDAGCGDAHEFVTNNGDSLADRDFRIELDYDLNQKCPYMDSFKWFNIEKGYAYNDDYRDYDAKAQNTDGTVDSEYIWDEYNQMWTKNSVRARIDEYTDGYVDCDHLDDFVEIGCEYYHEDMVDECPCCGEKFVRDRGNYSDLLDKTFCCQSCKNDGEAEWYRDNDYTYSQLTHQWSREDLVDVVSVTMWSNDEFVLERLEAHPSDLTNLVINKYVKVGGVDVVLQRSTATLLTWHDVKMCIAATPSKGMKGYMTYTELKKKYEEIQELKYKAV